jgi:hypothetical protein
MAFVNETFNCFLNLFTQICDCFGLILFNRDVKNATVGSPIAPISSVSVISYEGTLVSELKQATPLRTKLASALPDRPKGPARASSTSSLDRISEEKKTGSESVKHCFISGIGWASQVSDTGYNILQSPVNCIYFEIETFSLIEVTEKNIHHVFLFQLKSGEIQIQYNDGSQMKFHPTLLVVNYKDISGHHQR